MKSTRRAALREINGTQLESSKGCVARLIQPVIFKKQREQVNRKRTSSTGFGPMRGERITGIKMSPCEPCEQGDNDGHKKKTRLTGPFRASGLGNASMSRKGGRMSNLSLKETSITMARWARQTCAALQAPSLLDASSDKKRKGKGANSERASTLTTSSKTGGGHRLLANNLEGGESYGESGGFPLGLFSIGTSSRTPRTVLRKRRRKKRKFRR